MAGEGVEEFGVARERALIAEVIDGVDEPAAEHLGPEPVDDDASGEWVAGVGGPFGEAEAIGWVSWVEGEDGGGDACGDGIAGCVVGTALEEASGFGVCHFLHDHEGWDGILEGVEGGAGLLEGGGGGAGFGVEGAEPVGEERVGIGGRGEAGELRGFWWSEGAGEDAEVVDVAAFEATVAETLADGDLRGFTAVGVAGEVVADGVAGGGEAVDEELEAVGFAGAVAGHGDVGPLGDGEQVFGADGDGVAWPEVDEGGGETAVFDEELVAAASGVGPCAAAVEDDGAVFGVRGAEPEGDGEWLFAGEVATGVEVDAVFAVEGEGFAVRAVGELRVFEGLGGIVRLDVVSGEGFELEACEFVWGGER